MKYILAILLLATTANAEEAEIISPEDQRILQRGEISDGQYIGGGVIGTFIGLGIGHAVQNRYSDRGWIFTAGEAVSTAVVLSGALECIGHDGKCKSPMLAIGVAGFFGFRIWEIIDVWAAPPGLNERYNELKRLHPHAKWRMYPTIVGQQVGGVGFGYSF